VASTSSRPACSGMRAHQVQGLVAGDAQQPVVKQQVRLNRVACRHTSNMVSITTCSASCGSRSGSAEGVHPPPVRTVQHAQAGLVAAAMPASNSATCNSVSPSCRSLSVVRPAHRGLRMGVRPVYSEESHSAAARWNIENDLTPCGDVRVQLTSAVRRRDCRYEIAAHRPPGSDHRDPLVRPARP
jgi:hypothetical protein